VHLALSIVCFIMCLPALYALQVATLDIVAAFQAPPQLFPPGNALGANVATLFERLRFDRLILNTTVVSLAIVIGRQC
jgi:hypothetical protein